MFGCWRMVLNWLLIFVVRVICVRFIVRLSWVGGCVCSNWWCFVNFVFGVRSRYVCVIGCVIMCCVNVFCGCWYVCC